MSRNFQLSYSNAVAVGLANLPRFCKRVTSATMDSIRVAKPQVLKSIVQNCGGFAKPTATALLYDDWKLNQKSMKLLIQSNF